MPIYSVPEFSFDVNRRAVMLDTNILVAAFTESDEYHETAAVFLRDWSDPFIIPISVLVECWGMLAGSFKNWHAAMRLYEWSASPGNATIFPQEILSHELTIEMLRSTRVDSVDALIARMAHDISTQCSLNPPLTIATLDTGDIIKCRVEFDLKIDIFDLRSFEKY